MSYITKKKVNGNYYFYETESYRVGKKVKRRVIKYLGKVKELGKLPIIEKNECAYCRTKDNLVIDHIIPLSKGGTNELSNLQVLCKLCNQKKGNKIQ